MGSDRDLPTNSQREPPDTKKKVSMSVSGAQPGPHCFRARSPAVPEPPPLPPPPGIFSPRLPTPLRRPGGRGRAQSALLSRDSWAQRQLRPNRRARWGRGRAASPATFGGNWLDWGGGCLREHCRCHSPTKDLYLSKTSLQGFKVRQAHVAAGSRTSVPESALADGSVPS